MADPLPLLLVDEQDHLPGWTAEWVQVGQDGYLRIVDSTTGGFIINPLLQITDASRQIFALANRLRSVLSIRMRYKDNVVASWSVFADCLRTS